MSTTKLNSLLGLMNPKNYGLADELILNCKTSDYYTAFTSNESQIIQILNASSYGADYLYSNTFEENEVKIISGATIDDVVADEYTITDVEAYDSSGNEITVTIDGQTVTISDPSYVSGDVITIKIYISLNSEVITNFDDFLDTNEGNVTLYNSVEDVEITVESPKLAPNTSNYTVKYIDLYTNEEISDEKINENIAVNTEITATNEIIEIEGYTYIKTNVETLTVSSDEDENVIIIYYSYNSEVIVQYIDKATNEVIYTYTLEGLEGDSYSVIYEEQEGYILDERKYPDNEEGTYTKETIYVIYYLEKPVEITLTKVSSETSTDEDGNTVYTYLEGVEFSLYMLICEDETHDHDTDLIDTGSYDITCWELIGTYTTGSDGTFTLSDLPITGIYRLVETKTIEDYLLPEGQWKIEFDYGNLTEDEAVIDYNGQGVKITAIGNPPALSLQTVSTDDIETDILYLYNSSSYDVPTTGSFETNNFYLVGIPIILMGIIILLIWKRRIYTLNKFSSLRNSVNDARRIIDNWDKNS